MSQASFYGKDVNPHAKQDYLDEVIEPAYYPDGTGEAHLDKKYVKYWLSPMLDMVEDGRQNFAPQFWGDTAYGILVNQYIGSTDQPFADAIPLSEMKAIIASRAGATDFGSKLNTSRTYTTYCPAKIGYDPVNVGYFPDMVTGIGGTASVTGGVRDSSFVPYTYLNQRIRLHLFGYTGAPQQTFLFYADGATDNTDSTHSAYTQPPCFIGDGITYPNQASDLHAYLVTSTVTVLTDTGGTIVRYTTNWVVYSESNNFYRIFPAIDLGLAYGEPTNEPEGDETDVPIPIPDPSPNFAVACGMVKVYRLTLQDAVDLASDMWNENWWSQTGHWFGENPPYEAISSFGVVPYANDGESTLSWGERESITLAGHTLPTAHGNPVSRTVYTTTFNSLSVPTAYGGGFLDYEPYTTVQAMLPFIGWVNVPAQFVVGHTLTVTYVIDVISGGVNAFLSNEETGVFAMHSGSCLYAIPVSSADGGRLIDGILTAATAGVSLTAGGNITTTKSMNALSVAQHAFDTHVTMRGSASGNMGYCARGHVALYVFRPNVLDDTQYAPCVGFPTARYMQLSTCQGFTQVDSVNLSGLPASKPEIEQFEALLKSGIVIPFSGVVQPATSGGVSGQITIDLYTRTGCIHELNYSGSVTTRFSGIRGAFRTGDTPSMTKPMLVINKPFSDVALVNYVHVAEFNRFYFVEEAIALTSQTTMLVLSTDVLNSFWESAKSSYAYIARQENPTWQRIKMIDDKVVTGCMDGSTVDSWELQNSMAGEHQYIVVCAGS